MKTSELLLRLCEANGLPGAEDAAMEAAKAFLAPLGACEVAPLGSLICRMKPAQIDKPHVLLTAHLDSVGLIVTHIDEQGFLRVANCGGIDRATLLAAQVEVHTAGGILPGVICTIPPHLNTDDSNLPKLEEISIDVGYSVEQAKEKVAPGDRVTFVAPSRELPGGKLCARATDDRAGCAAVILAAQALAELPLECGLSVALTVQEETGGAGAATAANLLVPTHAYGVDVSFGHTPDCPRPKCGIMGEGPMVGVSPILDNGMLASLKATAKAREIPIQLEVMGGRTGTDLDGVAVSGAGVRCALLSIPQRYMHTPVEIVTLSDVEAVAELIAADVAATFGGAQ